MRSAQITARTEPKVKMGAEIILRRIGLNMSDAINMFLNQIILQRGLPFEARIPSDTTIQAMEDAINDKGLTTYESVYEMFEDLGIEH